MAIKRASHLPRRALQLLFIGLILFFLFRNIASHWQALTEYSFTVSLLPLLLSWPLFGLSCVSLVLGWRSLVKQLGFRIPFGDACRIVIKSSLGRYIPGKLWAAAGLIYLGKERGIPAREGLVGAILSTSLLIISGGSISCVGVMAGLGFRGSRFFFPLLLLAVVLLLLLHPRILLGIVNRGLRLFKKDPLGVAYSYFQLVKIFPYYLIFWLGMGGGFVLAVRALIAFPAATAPPLIAIYSLAYIGGILAVLAPAGLGVREGLMAYLLSGFFPAPLPAGISIYGRFWATICELSLLLLVLLMPVFRRDKNCSPGTGIKESGPSSENTCSRNSGRKGVSGKDGGG